MSLQALLNQVIEIKGVNSAAVVSSSGFVIEGAANNETDLSFVGGLIISGLASSRVLASFLGEGEVLQTMIEYENGPVLLIPLGGEDAPVMVATLASAAVLGRTRHSLRKLVPDIARAVSA
ncbi:hypothetical protein BH24DEI2_BH24DEI2_11830 [soil metagenome]